MMLSNGAWHGVVDGGGVFLMSLVVVIVVVVPTVTVGSAEGNYDAVFVRYYRAA
jgi:hypothetical protein